MSRNLLVCYKELAAILIAKTRNGVGRERRDLELGQSFEHRLVVLQLTSATSEVLATLQ